MAAILKSYLQSQKYHDIDWEAFKLHLHTNTNYPSLMAITDTLDHFEIDYMALEVAKEHLGSLPKSFLCIMLGEGHTSLALVKSKPRYIAVEYDYGQTIKMTINEFLDQWTGSVVLVNERPMTIQGYTNEAAWIGLAILMLTYTWMLHGTLPFFYTLFSILGFYLSWLAFQKSLGLDRAAADMVCRGIGDETGCNKLIGDKSHKLFGVLSYSQSALVYFGVLALSVCFFGIVESIAVLLSVLSIPVVITSLVAQWRSSTWCGLCLTIVAALIVQIFIVFIFADNLEFSISVVQVAPFAIFVLLSNIILHNIDKTARNNLEDAKIKHKFLRLKKSSGIFEFLLNTWPLVEIPYEAEGALWFGAGKDAPVQIISVLGPTCGVCNGAFASHHTILERFGDQVGLGLVLIAPFKDTAHIGTSVAMNVMKLYESDRAMAWAALKEWFDERNIEKWERAYKIYSPDHPMQYLEKLKASTKWFISSGLTNTPTTLLDGKVYPNTYDLDDLFWIIPNRIQNEYEPEYS